MAPQNTILDTNPADLRVLKTNEQVTKHTGAEMLRRALLLPNAPELESVLDNACGAGVVTAQLLEAISIGSIPKAPLEKIVAADVDPKMTAYVADRIVEDGWDSTGIEIEAMRFDQQDVPLPNASFTHAFSNFGVFFALDDHKALTETLRVLRPGGGGVAGFTSWKALSWWNALAVPAVKKFVPDAPTLPDVRAIFPDRGWGDEERAKGRLADAGFVDVVAEEFVFKVDVGAEAFGEACAVLVRSVAGRMWSEEENGRFAGEIEGALVRYLEEEFDGGKFDGDFKAIISFGRRA